MKLLNREDLHDYQELSVQRLIDNPFYALFIEMGGGKTVSTLTALDFLMYEDAAVLSALVIAPKRVAENVWSNEIEDWEHLKHLTISVIAGTPEERIRAVKTKADIHTVSRDNFVWLCEYFKYKLPYDMLIFDELSSFKNHKTNRFKAAKRVRASARRVVGLTGTPAPNSLIDLWAQMYILDFGRRLGRFVTHFENKYFERDPYSRFKKILRPGADKLIYDKIRDITLSMSTEDTGVKLPPLIFNHVKLRFSPELREQYKAFEKAKIMEILEDPESEDGNVISAPTAAALFSKLSQFANGAIYDEDKNSIEIHELKLEALEELVEEVQGKPMLIAYNFTQDKDRILHRLQKHKPRVLLTTKDLNDWMAGKIKVAVAHPASLGHGLNLQDGGHYITWYSLTSSLELYQQFNARLYRQGQTQNVVISVISIVGTMDDRLYEILNTKDKTQRSLMQAVRVRIEDYKNINR